MAFRRVLAMRAVRNIVDRYVRGGIGSTAIFAPTICRNSTAVDKVNQHALFLKLKL